MSLNIIKCYYVRCANQQHIIILTIYITMSLKNVILNPGILIDIKLTWSDHTDYMVKKLMEPYMSWFEA